MDEEAYENDEDIDEQPYDEQSSVKDRMENKKLRTYNDGFYRQNYTKTQQSEFVQDEEKCLTDRVKKSSLDENFFNSNHIKSNNYFNNKMKNNPPSENFTSKNFKNLQVNVAENNLDDFDKDDYSNYASQFQQTPYLYKHNDIDMKSEAQGGNNFAEGRKIYGGNKFIFPDSQFSNNYNNNPMIPDNISANKSADKPNKLLKKNFINDNISVNATNTYQGFHMDKIGFNDFVQNSANLAKPTVNFSKTFTGGFVQKRSMNTYQKPGFNQMLTPRRIPINQFNEKDESIHIYQNQKGQVNELPSWMFRLEMIIEELKNSPTLLSMINVSLKCVANISEFERKNTELMSIPAVLYDTKFFSSEEPVLKGSQTLKTLKSKNESMQKKNTVGNIKKKFDISKDDYQIPKEQEFFEMSLQTFKYL